MFPRSTLIGGERREMRMTARPGPARRLLALAPASAPERSARSNRRLPSGRFASANQEYILETGEFLRTADDVRNVVVACPFTASRFSCGMLRRLSDGGEEPERIRSLRRARREFLSGRYDCHIEAQGD